MAFEAGSTKPVKLLNVQVLRAYGALAVAFFHTDFTIGIGLKRPIGGFGVSIFFVISGFIMAMICDSDSRHFLARRIARIVPLYWVLTILVFAAGSIVPSLLGNTTADRAAVLKSLFFIPYLTHGAYFPILFLGWSLNYEMYFYLWIAAALLIHKRNAPLIAAAGMTAVLLGLRVLNVGGAAMFYAHPIIFEFILGILCYYGFRSLSEERIQANRTFFVFATIASALVMIAAAITTVGLLNAVIVGVTSTTLVLGAVLLDKAQVSLRWPVLILLGDASYAIYLIHLYCEEIQNKILARGLPILNTKTAVGMPFALVVSVVASLIVYRFLDNPLHVFFRNLLCKPVTLPRVSTREETGRNEQAELG
jgi:peptidoglycan/LPS O-acetylase OafA/YrhL